MPAMDFLSNNADCDYDDKVKLQTAKKALLYNLFTALLAVNTLNVDAQSFSIKSVVSYSFSA